MKADSCTFVADTCLKKCQDDEMLFETIQTFKRGKYIYISPQSFASVLYS